MSKKPVHNLPCPFCRLCNVARAHLDERCAWIHCNACDAVSGGCDSKREAIAMWFRAIVWKGMYF
jgi:hypothetical protein